MPPQKTKNPETFVQAQIYWVDKMKVKHNSKAQKQATTQYLKEVEKRREDMSTREILRK